MKLLKNRHPKRFAKFSIVGSLNFLVDIIILNSLSYITGFNKGFFAAVFSAISFLVANINSYYLNRKWTFRDNEKESRYKVFLAISIVGIVINILIVYSFTTYVSQSYFSDIIWLNISKMIATSLVIFFNYYSYKRYVFNRN
ncbi:MAG: GtrA family protein [Candidatus Pacebacteria bacterium]|nr:GtrA family protein [Candidatus Paceibacterota bacterium]